MPILEDSLRPFWVQGLNDISGHVVKGFGGWIRDEDFQIYSEVQADTFALAVADSRSLLSAFAADVNRLSTASLESAISVGRIERLPRSTAWIIIKAYYSAFFAAHSILRMLGLSVSRLDGNHVSSVNKIANAFGAISQPATKGFYRCAFDSNKKELICIKVNLGHGGIHEAFWSVFNARLRQLSNDVLISKVGTAANNQVSAAKLSELSDNLCGDPATGGNWLSFIRNEVNYSHRWGASYPYEGYQATHHDRLYESYSIWEEDPLNIDLASYVGRDLLRFQQTCNFLVALCRALAIDMSKRCSKGISFHTYGSLAVLNLIRQKAHTQNVKVGR